MVSPAVLADAIYVLTYASIAIIAVALVGKAILCLQARRSRFGRILLTLVAVLTAFLLAEIAHLWDMRAGRVEAEIAYSLLTVGAFVLFAMLMRSMRAFGEQVGFASSEFAMRVRLQRQLCPECANVRFKVPLTTLMDRDLITRDGALAAGVTLELLEQRGFVEHRHRRRDGARRR